MRKRLPILVRLIAAVLALPVLYVLGGILGGLIPANVGWEQPSRGVLVFVRTNGVHTWIMVPAVSRAFDWRSLAPAAHLKDPRGPSGYLAFGFGNRDFYLNTPTWADLTFSTAAAAAFGRGPGLLHVEHVSKPAVDARHRPILLRPDQHQRLVAFIRGSFDVDPQGRSKPLLGRGYGPTDVFYQARGPYHALRTCNEWTGQALRRAGVRVGVWTPFEQSIMMRFD